MIEGTNHYSHSDDELVDYDDEIEEENILEENPPLDLAEMQGDSSPFKTNTPEQHNTVQGEKGRRQSPSRHTIKNLRGDVIPNRRPTTNHIRNPITKAHGV